jgi:Icc-related predicted phosphoesterase
MLEISSIDSQPISELLYLNAAPRRGTEVRRIAVERARVRELPEGLDAIIVTSDLQGIVPHPITGQSTLLGVAVAEHLAGLSEDGVLPPTARTGVVLAGDLYSVPAANERGGYGDVSEVWDAFAGFFAWVVGVAGNHDDVSAVRTQADVVVLDGKYVELDGLRIGGVGLIVGNAAKVGRRGESEQLARIAHVVASQLDLLVLHEGPSGDGNQTGNAEIRRLIEQRRVPFTVCGHVHWENPVARHSGGQVLNVDARIVVLSRAE